MKDPVTGRSRGFGFIRYENEDASDKAIAALNDYEWV